MDARLRLISDKVQLFAPTTSKRLSDFILLPLLRRKSSPRLLRGVELVR
jgi:hypothetical protein